MQDAWFNMSHVDVLRFSNEVEYQSIRASILEQYLYRQNIQMLIKLQMLKESKI